MSNLSAAEETHVPPAAASEEAPLPPEARPAAPPRAPRDAFAKNPLLAGFLSLFPGMGNVYNGLYLRGVTFFLILAGLIGAVNSGAPEIFGFGIAFFWIFNVIDAYRQASLINLGYAQDLGLTDLPERPSPGQGGLWAGAVLVIVGATALLEQWFDFDLRWLFELWPVVLIAVGAWLIWATLREKAKAKRDAASF